MVSAAVKERLRKMREKFGLGEYRNKKATTPKKVKFKHKRGVIMARRKRSSKRSGAFGSSSLMTGIIKPKGIIAAAILGAGAATLIENANFKPLGDMTGLAAGFLVGGVGGAAGAYGRNMLKGTTVSGNVSAYGNY